MTVKITPQRYQMLVDERDELRKKLDSERKELADARGSDHEPIVNIQLLDVAERIGTIQGRIGMLDEIIANAKITEPCREFVGIGSKVLLCLNGANAHDRLLAYIDGIGGTYNQVPILTPEAPMIQKIMGLKKDQEAEFISPRGEKITVTVVDVSAYC